MKPEELLKAIEENKSIVIVEDAKGIQHTAITGVTIDRHGRIIIKMAD